MATCIYSYSIHEIYSREKFLLCATMLFLFNIQIEDTFLGGDISDQTPKIKSNLDFIGWSVINLLIPALWCTFHVQCYTLSSSNGWLFSGIRWRQGKCEQGNVVYIIISVCFHLNIFRCCIHWVCFWVKRRGRCLVLFRLTKLLESDMFQICTYKVTLKRCFE